MLNVITDNIDLWASAQKKKKAVGRGSSKKFELYGIKKLRELILQLAVQGKLVPQDSNDEPASELLKKIEAEKNLLIKEKKIKKQKPLPIMSTDEMSFKVPNNWEWIRLGTLGNIFNGNSVSVSKKEALYTNIVSGLAFIATKDVDYGWKSLDYDNGISIPKGEEKFKVAHKGAVLICAEGGSAGKKCGITNQDICFGNKLFAIETYGNVDSRYLLSNYLTPIFFTQFKEKMSGIIGGISKTNFESLVIPLPSIKEQLRIASKIDELMALCDQLEQEETDTKAAHQTLVKTLLNTLTTVKTAVEFQQSWQRIAEHFDILFTTEESIEELKQAILQLAVMGKLIPQDPNDEPARELLKKIVAKKEKLIKEKKIKKKRTLPPISDEEKLYDLPEGWEWERLDNFTVVGTGSTPSRDDFSYYNPPEFNWVTSGETSNDFVFDTKEKVSEKAIKETNVSIYPIGTLIVAMYGQGKTRGQITELMIKAGTNQACATIQLLETLKEHRGYIKLFFKKAYKELRSLASGGAQPNLNVGKISSTVIPIPPLSEQGRIVTKVDELMTLCDQLKQCMVDSKSTQLHLADAIVEQAVV